MTHDEDTLMRGAPSAYDDAVRYIEIQDAQWALMGSTIGYGPEPHNSIPL